LWTTWPLLQLLDCATDICKGMGGAAPLNLTKAQGGSNATVYRAPLAVREETEAGEDGT
jgi:hypothetical protein